MWISSATKSLCAVARDSAAEIGNGSIRMKTEHVKTTGITEEVSSDGMKKHAESPKSHRSAVCLRKPGRTGKKTCNCVEQEENHEKGLGGS